VPEALERLTECYLSLGLKDEARKTAAVLGYNYPGSSWYAATYVLVAGKQQAENLQQPAADKPGWFSRMFSIF
jgi:outer membrane protein assembly factor BamD